MVSSYLNSLEFARRRLQEPRAGPAPQVAERDGFKILADPEDSAVGRTVLRGEYEPEVVAVFRRELRPGMNAIDIGANIGFFSMLAASLVGPSGSVLAVEPNGGNARLAEASRRLNGFAHMRVLQAAAGREPGMLSLNTSFSNGTTSALEEGFILHAETVGCIAIDQIVTPGRQIHLIKLDVEGAEYNALLGCQQILRRDRPVLVFEFGPGQLPGISGVTGPQLLEWIIGQGYVLEVIRPDGGTDPVGRRWELAMQAYDARGRDHIDMVARPSPEAGRRGRIGSIGEALAGLIRPLGRPSAG